MKKKPSKKKAQCKRHCYHAPRTIWNSMSWPPRNEEMVCCHCGRGELADHGAFHPEKAQPVVSVPTVWVVPNAIDNGTAKITTTIATTS